jgi:hypothetical protein
MGVPASSSSDRASCHGQRIGTQACGAGAHQPETQPSAASIPAARIPIVLIYSGIGAGGKRS